MATINLRDFQTEAYVFTEFDSTLRVMGGIEYDGAGAALTGTNGIQRLVVLSDISGTDEGIRLTADAPDTRIIIRSDASVYGGNTGVVVEGPGQRLLNSGAITSDAVGVLSLGEAAIVNNRGAITADIGVNFLNGARVVNSGTITGESVGVSVQSFGQTVLINRGDLSGGEIAVEVGRSELRLVNLGTMTGDTVVDAGYARGLTLINRGSIAATDADEGMAIIGSGADDLVRNRGEITGDVDLGFGDDVFVSRNGDLIDADVHGGEGNDRLSGSAGDDNLFGDAGDDLLIGHAGDDVLSGGDGNDILRGGDGSDWLTGGDGNDTLRSGNGVEDLLDGGAGDDRLVANGDANSNAYLDGGEGNDLLVHRGDGFAEMFGGAGDDRLIARTDEAGETRMSGGAGDDYLIGNNSGSQTAVYEGGLDDYALVQLGNGRVMVTDLREDGTDGRDMLVRMDAIEFGDGTVLEWNVEDGVWA